MLIIPSAHNVERNETQIHFLCHSIIYVAIYDSQPVRLKWVVEGWLEPGGGGDEGLGGGRGESGLNAQ
jgi:hypothetical protein